MGEGPPLIPPSQPLIRLQMADGPPPLPHFHDKGGARWGGAPARWTLVTLSCSSADEVGASLRCQRMRG